MIRKIARILPMNPHKNIKPFNQHKNSNRFNNIWGKRKSNEPNSTLEFGKEINISSNLTFNNQETFKSSSS